MSLLFYYPGNPFEYGGIGKWIYEITNRLSRKYAINIIGLENTSSKSHYNLPSSINVHILSSIRPPIGVLLPHSSEIKKIKYLINSVDVTYIIVPSYPNELLLNLINKNTNNKVIAGFHGYIRMDSLLYRLYLPIFKYNLKQFHAYHVLNKYTFEWLKHEGYDNVFRITNGVDTQFFDLFYNSDDAFSFNILYAGWLFDYKGIDTLLAIAKYFKDKMEFNIKFTICGSGPLKDKVILAEKKYGNINYIGFIPPEEMPKIYRAAHLFLLPSRMEGMPFSLLEAQSCGLPFVGSNIPGISDILSTNNGIIVPPNQVVSYINSIKKYYYIWSSNPVRYYQLGKQIRYHIIKNYDWNIILNRFEQMLDTCMK